MAKIKMVYNLLSKKEREKFEKSQQEFYDKYMKNRNKKQEGE